MISEGEKWARIVIFIIVGAYTLVVLLLTVRFLIRTCCYPHEDERSRWQQIIAEQEARRLRLRAEESPPPPFLAALKCPLPRSNSVSDEEPPPSYDDVYSRSEKVSPNPDLMDPQPQCQCKCLGGPRVGTGRDFRFEFEGVTVVHL